MIFGFICLLIGFYLGVAFMAIMSIAKEKKKENNQNLKPDNLSARKEGENDVRISWIQIKELRLQIC